MKDYEVLYDGHAKADTADTAIGNGHYDAIGRNELDLLVMAGLKPNHTLVDFGCGNGRLAVHAIPFLVGGSYIGIDISQTFLRRAEQRVAERVPVPPCRVNWVYQRTPHFALNDDSVDMICAFSVFTHMEHEDNYRYLKAAARVVRPGGRFVYSCVPIHLTGAKDIFTAEAELDLDARWDKFRTFVTTTELMDEIARLAGWAPVRWFPGDEPNIGAPGGPMRAFGQSACVLQVVK